MEMGNKTSNRTGVHKQYVTIRDFVSDDVILATLITVIVGSVVTNLYVIFSIYVTRQMNNVTSMLFVSMSVAQLVMGGVVPLFAMIQTLHPGSTSGMACEMPVYIELAIVACTIFSHIAVGIDRYIAVVHPAKRTRLTGRSAVPIVAAIWVCSVLYSLRLTLQFDETRTKDKNFCNLFVEEKEENLLFRSLDFTCLFVLPLLLLSYLYGRVMYELWIRHKATTNVRRNRRVVKFLAVSLALFFMSWFPFYILDMAGDARKSMLPPDRIHEVENNRTYVSLRYTFVLMAVGNCFLTPLIYILSFPNLRRETCTKVRAVLRSRRLAASGREMISRTRVTVLQINSLSRTMAKVHPAKSSVSSVPIMKINSSDRELVNKGSLRATATV